MATTSTSPAMDLQPRGGLARAMALVGAVCALCGVALWATAGGPGQASVPTQVLYVPGALRAPTVAAPQPLSQERAPTTVSEPQTPPSVDTPTRAGDPAMSMVHDATKGPFISIEQLALNEDVNTVVKSDNMCTRRAAMARAAGLAAGLALATVNAPGYAAETKMVKMGSDSGQLVFIPDEVKICKGDTVTWVNNKGGPHNVVFDEEAIPAGFNTAGYSMEDQLGDEGATYSKKFDVPGTYEYYCEPHVGGGMKGTLIVG